MSAPESHVSAKYGAPMGRGISLPLLGKIRLRRARLDSGGYDKGGAYWGHGVPLWYAEGDDGFAYVRAHSRELAKTELRRLGAIADKASFYR